MITVWTETDDIILSRIDADFYVPEFIAHERYVERIATNGPVNVEPLGSLAKLKTGPFGSKLPATLYRDKGFPLFRVQNVVPFFPTTDSVVFLDEQSQLDLAASEVQSGDVLVSKAGRVGDACIVPANFGRCNITEHVIAVLSADTDPYYLVASLNSDFVKKQMRRFGLGTIINYLGVEATRSVQVPIPSPEIQRAIGNKIRKAERLRELAEACYQSVSNEFAVLLPKNHSQDQHKSSFIRATDISTGRLDAKFYAPQHLANRQRIALIAKTRKLHDFVHSVSNGCEVRDFQESGLRYLVVGNIDKGKLHINNAPFISQSSDIPQKAIIQEGDVLVVRTGSIGQAAAVLNEDVKDKTVISSHFIKLSLNKSEDATYLSSFLNSFVGKMLQEQISYGAVQQQISQDELLELPIPIFDKTKEHYIAQNHLSWRRYLGQSEQFVSESKQDIEALIDGTLDQDALIDEGTQLETWLREHPSLNTGETNHA